ncbi:MAG TPA: hypothetical protein VMT52_10900, partial [Planctomycetota bacterium]|nr:hypothetical protein [Planctomycetota bacterium]
MIDYRNRPLSCRDRGDRAPRRVDPSRLLGWSASLAIHAAVLALGLAWIPLLDFDTAAVPSLARGTHGMLIRWGVPSARASAARSDPGGAASTADLLPPLPSPAPSFSSLVRQSAAGVTAADTSLASLASL